MKIIKIWALLVITVGGLKKGKFGRMGHFKRHHTRSGSPMRHNMLDRHTQHIRPLPYGLKWPKKTKNYHKVKAENLRKMSLKKSARRLFCHDITCTACTTYYAFEGEIPIMKTECPETTAERLSLVYGICCGQERLEPLIIFQLEKSNKNTI